MELTLLFLTFIIGTVGALVLLHHRLTFWTRKGLIPHLRIVPIFGNTFSVWFLRKKSMGEFLCQAYNRFPKAKYVGVMDLNNPVILLRDPELIKDVCVKMFDHFTDHYSLVSENQDPIMGKNLATLTGSRWREIRNTLSPSFTGSKMKFMFKLVSRCSQHFVDYFLKHPEEAKLVDMKDAFTRYTNDVIATAAFGISVDSMKDRENEFYLRGKEAWNLLNVINLIKIFAFRFFPTAMRFVGTSILSRETNRFFKRVVEDTLKMRQEQNIVRPDMIHLLMEASDRKNLETDDIIAQAFIFFLAGFSTATLMGFVGHELAMNPEVQEKLRSEIDSFTEQKGGDISYETVSKMKYLEMVIFETLRKYPTAVVIDRVCVEKYTLPKSTPESEEFTLLPNSLVWIPICALHHDDKYFPNPDKFDPERFSDENKDNINPHVYIPFGLGPRKCIAFRFALMQTKILFIHLLQNFVLEKSEKTKHPVELEKAFHLAVKGNFWIKFQRRS